MKHLLFQNAYFHMRPWRKGLCSLALSSLVLTACSEEATPPEEEKVTETRMDDVDVLEGTISDDMIDLDAASQSIENDENDEGADDKKDKGAKPKAASSRKRQVQEPETDTNPPGSSSSNSNPSDSGAVESQDESGPQDADQAE